jgi:hypothetical protein
VEEETIVKFWEGYEKLLRRIAEGAVGAKASFEDVGKVLA